MSQSGDFLSMQLIYQGKRLPSTNQFSERIQRYIHRKTLEQWTKVHRVHPNHNPPILEIEKGKT